MITIFLLILELPIPDLGSVEELTEICKQVFRATRPTELGYSYEDLKNMDDISVSIMPEKKGMVFKHVEYLVESRVGGEDISPLSPFPPPSSLLPPPSSLLTSLSPLPPLPSPSLPSPLTHSFSIPRSLKPLLGGGIETLNLSTRPLLASTPID